jgi:hypothetical protein
MKKRKPGKESKEKEKEEEKTRRKKAAELTAKGVGSRLQISVSPKRKEGKA